MEIRPDPEGLERLLVSAPEFDAEFEVYGNCPVQAFGTVLDREMYFRARHDSWSFDVADRNGNLPSDGYQDSDGFYREGNHTDAGWMQLRDAVRIKSMPASEVFAIEDGAKTLRRTGFRGVQYGELREQDRNEGEVWNVFHGMGPLSHAGGQPRSSW